MSTFTLPTSVTKEAIDAKKAALIAAREAAIQTIRAEAEAIQTAVNSLINPKIQAALSAIDIETLDLTTSFEFDINIGTLLSQYEEFKILSAIDQHEFVGSVGGYGSRVLNQDSVRIKIPWNPLLEKIQET
jgi:hypothetical protein